MINDPVLIHDWHPVASVSQLEDKALLSVRLLDEDVLIWSSQGRIYAWQDLCIHRGTKLSLGEIVDGDKVQCPYHGWTYNTEGRCVHIPAHPEQTPPEKAVVKTYQTQEKYGLIWVCLGEPAHDIAPFPEWDNDEYRKILCGPYELNACGTRVVENFLDIGHFPFVHEGILGVKERPEIEDYESEITPDGVLSKGVKVYQPDPYGTGQGDTVAYTYKAIRPLTAYLLKESEGPSFSILLTITPHETVQSTAWMWMAMNYGHDIAEQELIEWQDEILSQDLPIVESQRPELLPLDLQAELHLTSDRTAISYRKWLNEMGLTFGTA